MASEQVTKEVADRRGGCWVLAGMNVNIWDVQPQIQQLVRAGHAGTVVDFAKLVDADVPLISLV